MKCIKILLKCKIQEIFILKERFYINAKRQLNYSHGVTHALKTGILS